MGPLLSAWTFAQSPRRPILDPSLRSSDSSTQKDTFWPRQTVGESFELAWIYQSPGALFCSLRKGALVLLKSLQDGALRQGFQPFPQEFRQDARTAFGQDQPQAGILPLPFRGTDQGKRP
jgi:hypothetical protein